MEAAVAASVFVLVTAGIFAAFVLHAELAFASKPRVTFVDLPSDCPIRANASVLYMQGSLGFDWRVEVMSKELLNKKYPLPGEERWGASTIETAWQPFGRKRYVVHVCPPNLPGIIAYELAIRCAPHADGRGWGGAAEQDRDLERQIGSELITRA